MEEETNNSELLINPTTEPTQPTPAPDTEVKQEQSTTPKTEETKMSEVDLSQFSAEELQAALEKKKAEEAKPKFVLDENDPSNLARFLMDNIAIRLGGNSFTLGNEIAKYPGKLTKFCWMYDENDKRTNDKTKVTTIHVVSVFEDYVIETNVISPEPAFSKILSKIGETQFNETVEYRVSHCSDKK